MHNHQLALAQSNNLSSAPLPANRALPHRNFLKEGRYNLLFSWVLSNFNDDGPLIITPSMIAEEISPALSINRTTVARQLSECAIKGNFPHFTIKESGQKRRDRKWVITFKGSVEPTHCWSIEKEPDDGKKKSAIERLVIGALQWEAICLKRDSSHKRMTGEQLASRIGCTLRTVRRVAAKAVLSGDLERTAIFELYKYVRKRKITKKIMYTSTRIRCRSVTQTIRATHEVQNVTPSPCALHREKILPFGVKSQNSLNENKQVLQPHVKYASCWWEYRQHFCTSDTENLKTTIFHGLKKGLRLPDPEKFVTAIKAAASIKFLKLAHTIGWREAQKSVFIEKGGALNDKSKHWKKHTHNRLNLLWIWKHIEKINSGYYENKPLSAKATRTFEEAASAAIENTPTIRPETPVETLRQHIMDISTGEEEKALRERLLDQHGTYTYENWFQDCGWDAEGGMLTHGCDFRRATIERKYGVRVDSK